MALAPAPRAAAEPVAGDDAAAAAGDQAAAAVEPRARGLCRGELERNPLLERDDERARRRGADRAPTRRAGDADRMPTPSDALRSASSPRRPSDGRSTPTIDTDLAGDDDRATAAGRSRRADGAPPRRGGGGRATSTTTSGTRADAARDRPPCASTCSSQLDVDFADPDRPADRACSSSTSSTRPAISPATRDARRAPRLPARRRSKRRSTPLQKFDPAGVVRPQPRRMPGAAAAATATGSTRRCRRCSTNLELLAKRDRAAADAASAASTPRISPTWSAEIRALEPEAGPRLRRRAGAAGRCPTSSCGRSRTAAGWSS